MAHKKRKPRKLIITRHDDGTYSHEHMHDDGKHSMFAGTSQSLDDLHQHVSDTFGGGGPEEESEETPNPAPAQAAPEPGE